ncbi:MAG: TIGR00374 family protein [Alphaproteobacteria bacterium]|nr:TIGR00374 family protein [Alphaproteobacteria bacterium]
MARAWTLLFLLLGFGLMAGLIAFEDAGAIGAAIASAGWGIAVVTLFHLVPLVIDALGIRSLIRPEHRIPFWRVAGLYWIGESINTLLPVAQIGGEFVRTRLMVMSGIPGVAAGAYVVANLTVGVFTQGLFAIIGLIILVSQYGEGNDATSRAAIGAGIILGGVSLFYLAQRNGLFGFIGRFFQTLARGKDWLTLVGGAAELDGAVLAVYKRRGAIFRTMGWQFASWVLGTGEVWLALHFMGHDVSLLDAMMIEALGQAVRSAAFLVPGSLGVQEGGYVLLGAVIGLPTGVSLALSLIKRVREIGLGVPGLIAWQVIEGRRWLILRR